MHVYNAPSTNKTDPVLAALFDVVGHSATRD